MMRLAPAALALILAAPPAMAETVTFPGEGVTLRAVQYRPSGEGPFPAVLALHGCAGLYGARGDLSPRHADWAERLARQGFIVLLPDSFGSRGAGSQCRAEDRVARPSRERVADAYAAKAYLQARKDVKANAISLLGWSNGGSTVLYTVDPRRPPLAGAPDFAKAIAFYPGCRTPLESGRWRTRLPLLILIGAADDWTPAGPCRDLIAAAKERGTPAEIVLYPGAYHDFDHPNLPVRTHKGVAYSAKGDGVVHTGTDPAARADALRRVPAFLAR
jgi:dienelactone hydrolase